MDEDARVESGPTTESRDAMSESASVTNDAVKRILHAALENIAAEKISGSYLRDIASRAGISQGTLHYYFPSKMGLYQAVLENMSRTFIEQRKSSLEDPGSAPREKLGIFFSQMKDVLLHQRSMMLVYYDFWVQASRDSEIQATVKRIYDRWRADINRVLAEGVKRGDFEQERTCMLSQLMVSLMEGASLQYMVDRDGIDLDTYFERANEAVQHLLD